MSLLKSPYLKMSLVAVSLALTACLNDRLVETGEPKNPVELQKPKGPGLFVVVSDYTSGVLRSLTLDSLKFGPDSIQVNQDSRVLSIKGSIYVLERYGADNILKYDPVEGKVKYQKHLGKGWNPSDLILWKGTTGFISLQDHPVLLKYDLENGSIIDSLNIAAFSHVGDSGVASSPHATALALKGDYLYLALQRRNKAYQLPGGKSMVLIVNAKTFSIVDSIIAPDKNAGDMWIAGNDLYLSCPNGYDKLNDGALYRWSLTVKGWTKVVTEAQLGGHINAIACDTLGQCAAAIYRGWQDVQIRRFQLSTGKVDADFLPGITDAFGGLAVNPATGNFYIGERNAIGAGILMFDQNGVKLRGPVSTGLPPYSLSILED